MAWVVKEKGAPTTIDTDGKEIFTAKDVYSVSCYSEGLARFSQRTDDDGRIKYGYMNNAGNVCYSFDTFDDDYVLQSYKDMLKTKTGVCFDQVELERELFKNTKFKYETYFCLLYTSPSPRDRG